MNWHHIWKWLFLISTSNIDYVFNAELDKFCSLNTRHKSGSHHMCMQHALLEGLLEHFHSLHRDAFFKFLFRWIYYYHSSKLTGKETGKTHAPLCALAWLHIYAAINCHNDELCLCWTWLDCLRIDSEFVILLAESNQFLLKIFLFSFS